MPGERIVHWSGPHPVAYLKPALLTAGGLAAAALLGRGLHCWAGCVVAAATTLAAAPDILRHLSCEYGVTNRRVCAKTGWFGRLSMETSLNRVGSITVYQSLLGRIFDYGDVTVAVPGGKQAELRLLRSPGEFRKRIFEQIAPAKKA